MKYISTILIALGLTACGPSPENDPVYQALKANPPTEIPAKHLPKLRRGGFSCDVYEEGTPQQYMTCWWPNYEKNTKRNASLTYYGPGLPRPHPKYISTPGGEPVISRVPFQ